MVFPLEQRSQLALRIVALGFMAGVILSWPLWTGDRLYPLFPVWEWVPAFPGVGGTIGALALTFGLGWIAARPSHGIVCAVLAICFILFLQDQSRWQPWAYQYALMFLPFAFARSWKGLEGSLAGILRGIVVMVYAWGGIHKCQSGWMSVWEKSLVAPLIEGQETGFVPSLVLGFGYLVPPIEILMALGLLFRLTRGYAIGAVMATHVVILILLGPAKGHISNSVVWPWNIAMMVLVIVLFYREESLSLLAWTKDRLRLPGWPIAVLTVVAPLFFYAGLWDRYLSFSLYAGQQRSFLARIDAAHVERLPEEWGKWLIDPEAADGHRILSASSWSTDEMNVPVISEWRILRALSRYLCEEELAGTNPVFYMHYRHLPHKPKRFYTCEQIDEMR